MTPNMLQTIGTSLPGVLLLTPLVFRDERGLFTEIFNQTHLHEAGIDETWEQVNFSRSEENVLRGLHFQFPHPQAKLLRVLKGSIYDVTLDIRPQSKSFGKWQSIILHADKNHTIFIPKGFAHGFCTVEGSAEILYACSDTYHPECGKGVNWSDPELKIPWPASSPVVSTQDKQHPTLKQLSPWLREVFL